MKRSDLSGEIAGMRIDPAIMIASGILSNPYSLKEMEEYVGGYVIKTSGTKKRGGNETPVFCQVSDGIYLNAMGLPDPGYRQVKREVKEARPKKPVFASISGENEKDIAKVARGLNPDVVAFEGNFSCPNVKPGETLGITIGYDPARVRSYTTAVRSSTKKPFFVKLPTALYIFNRERFLETAEAALEEGATGLTLINTIPGGMKINIHAKYPVLSTKYGSVSGRAAKPIGIGCVYAAREAFSGIPIMGLGGIETAEDVVEYVQAGADVVQIGSALSMKNTKEKQNYLGNLLERLDTLISELGYSSLIEMRGVAHGKK